MSGVNVEASAEAPTALRWCREAGIPTRHIAHDASIGAIEMFADPIAPVRSARFTERLRAQAVPVREPSATGS
jgi:hypothetical protein